MLKSIILSFGVLFFTGQMLPGQTGFRDKEEELAFYADVMYSAHKATHREIAAAKFENQFREVLENPGSFAYNFDSLQWISRIYPSDSLFRIFSWVLIGNQGNSHKGILQLNDGRMFTLTEQNWSWPNQELLYEELNHNNWLGQVYYDLQEFEKEQHKSYLLFGKHYGQDGKTIKITEEIRLHDNDIIFGSEIFYKDGDRHGDYRLILAYNSVAQAIQQYDKELGIIVFDHLTPVINPFESDQVIMVPDGTYEGYQLKNGKWTYLEKVFHQIYDVPPAPDHKDSDRSKDLFGK